MSKRVVPSQPRAFVTFGEPLKRRIALAAEEDRRLLGQEIVFLVEQALALREQQTAKPSDGKK